MTSNLEPADRAVFEGRFAAALSILWDRLPVAQDRDDGETLKGIYALAGEIELKGSSPQAAEARRLRDGIATVNPRMVSALGEQAPRMTITTGNDIPGYEITAVIGPVFGLSVRSRDVFQQWGSKLKAGTVGGELGAMTEAMEQTRIQVLARMEARARSLGADAVIAMRFDANEMAGMWTEIAAYGTAVRARSVDGTGQNGQSARSTPE